MAPQRIVYVSCDPATLARDVKLFAQEGYAAVRAAAVDMFPVRRMLRRWCSWNAVYNKENPPVGSSRGRVFRYNTKIHRENRWKTH